MDPMLLRLARLARLLRLMRLVRKLKGFDATRSHSGRSAMLNPLLERRPVLHITWRNSFRKHLNLRPMTLRFRSTSRERATCGVRIPMSVFQRSQLPNGSWHGM